MPVRVEDICDACDESVMVGDRLACRFVGATAPDGRFVVSCCALKAMWAMPTQRCANPATPHKWDGAIRPKPPEPRAVNSLTVVSSDGMQRIVRICLGHPTGGPDAVPRCEKANDCRKWGLEKCPDGKW